MQVKLIWVETIRKQKKVTASLMRDSMCFHTLCKYIPKHIRMHLRAMCSLYHDKTLLTVVVDLVKIDPEDGIRVLAILEDFLDEILIHIFVFSLGVLLLVHVVVVVTEQRCSDR